MFANFITITIPSREPPKKKRPSTKSVETPLPNTYQPGEFDVICARGKKAWNHSGNKIFRAAVDSNIAKYEKTKNKVERTAIVSELVNMTRARGVGFVKETSDGWVIIPDQQAREKVGQMFRDSLCSKYKSSFKQKKLRRREASKKVCDNVEQVIHSNAVVSQTIHEMRRSFEVPSQNNTKNKNNNNMMMISDDFVSQLFCQANARILDALKRDQNMLSKFHEAATMDDSDSVGNDDNDNDDQSNNSNNNVVETASNDKND